MVSDRSFSIRLKSMLKSFIDIYVYSGWLYVCSSLAKKLTSIKAVISVVRFIEFTSTIVETFLD